MGGYFAILRPFRQNSGISRRRADDNETLCAVKPCFAVETVSPQAGLELGTARSVGQPLSYRGS